MSLQHDIRTELSAATDAIRAAADRLESAAVLECQAQEPWAVYRRILAVQAMHRLAEKLVKEQAAITRG